MSIATLTLVCVGCGHETRVDARALEGVSEIPLCAKCFSPSYVKEAEVLEHGC
jgi:hypothetical protein